MELRHIGKKGMRWGHRKAPTIINNQPTNINKQVPVKKKMSTKTKVGIAIGIGAAVIASAVGIGLLAKKASKSDIKSMDSAIKKTNDLVDGLSKLAAQEEKIKAMSINWK